MACVLYSISMMGVETVCGWHTRVQQEHGTSAACVVTWYRWRGFVPVQIKSASTTINFQQALIVAVTHADKVVWASKHKA
jgi:hypothetical protein